jgi:drug/metabolite transporter superfamily protein YnfA
MIFALLLLAAILEVGGDALVRGGLQTHGAARIGFMITGAIILFGYGLFVNLSPLDFGRALGVYVAVFFVVAQMVNWLAFGVQPGAVIFLGGALICAGGTMLAIWQ